MTPSKLKAAVTARGSKFFTRNNMKFAGDTMRNYGVTGPVTLKTNSGDIVKCWELFRRRPVKCGLRSSAYFSVDSFEERWGEVQSDDLPGASPTTATEQP